jgi:putative sterol carrier protein
LKNHGVVSVGETLRDAFFLAELLEESARMNILSGLLQGNRKFAKISSAAQRKKKPVKLFSKKHRSLLQAAISRKRRPQHGMDGLLSLRLKADDTGDEYAAIIEQGGLPARTGRAPGTLVISGTSGAWKNIFNGRMDPFTAVIQNKMRFSGSLQELLRWYPALHPLFRKWQTIPVM